MSELQDAHDAEWARVRAARDLKLAESDWMVARAAESGAAVPTEWAIYRQALRDLTKELNPFLLSWPVEPQQPEKPRRLYTLA